MRFITLLILSLVLMVHIGPTQAATTFTDTDFIDAQIADGISRISTIEFAPDGRLFVLQQTGTVRIIEDGTLLTTPFIEITVDSSTGERGLLGIAFDPNFDTNNYFYLYYTAPQSFNRVSRFTASGNTADPNTEVVYLDLEPLPSSSNNHNGGTLKFGPDDKLYIASGDGDLVPPTSQNLSTFFGKILRLNPDGTIPMDNPFYNTNTGDYRAIWAYGLRNPYTYDFQPGTGLMYINDVGASTWEEINEGIAGANYGWPDSEGETSNPAFTSPVFTYEHTAANGNPCALTGGTFYNPNTAEYPTEYIGDYFFIDYCGDWIWHYDNDTDSVSTFAEGIASRSVDITTGPDGTLYYASRFDEGIYRIVYRPLASYDVNGDNFITPSDAVAVWNRIGDPATIYDLTGDLNIDASDVNAVIARIGQSIPNG